MRDVIKKHGISEPTFYAWKRKFGGMDVAEAKKLRPPSAHELPTAEPLAADLPDRSG